MFDPVSRPAPLAEAIAAYRAALLRHAPPDELARLASALDSEIVAWLDIFHTSHQEAVQPDPTFVRRLDKVIAAAPGPRQSSSPSDMLAPLRILRPHSANGKGREATMHAVNSTLTARPWGISWPQSAARLAATVLLIALLVGSAWAALYPLGLWDNEGLPLIAPEGTPAVAPAPGDALVFLWKSEGGPERLSVPYGLGIDPDGNLWVSDAGHDRFQILAPDGTHLETWGSPGDREGQFEFLSSRSRYGYPYGDVAFDSDGNIYVVDTGNFRVQKFAPDRSFLLAWGSEGEGDGQFLVASSIAVGPDGTVYVSDENQLDIQAFDADGRFLHSIAVPELANRLSVPAGITIDAGGDIWLADYGASRILRFSPSGELLSTWGTLGGSDGELSGSNDVAIDDAGHVFVADDGNNRLQVFTEDGQFLNTVGGYVSGATSRLADARAVSVSADGVVYVTGDPTIQAYRFTMSDSG
jgi:DNA-binding beta-propeller fold protein YncE